MNPFLETKLKRLTYLSDNTKLDYSDISIFFNHTKNDKQANIWLDGIDTEHKFYKNILPEFLGENYKKFVLPQVNISSLTGESASNIKKERIDFLICLHDKKIVVELDGVEHKAHESIDNLRKEKIENSGYEVFRIENHEMTSPP